MREPTTEWQIATQQEVKINRDFLLSIGWVLKEEHPLWDLYEYCDDTDISCSIGLYGELSITKVHWMNKTPEIYFSAINPRLTTDDYYKIVEMLNLSILKPKINKA